MTTMSPHARYQRSAKGRETRARYEATDRAKEARRRREAARVVRRRATIAQIKVERGCIDCGFRAHSAALHFDHRVPSQKVLVVARAMNRGFGQIMAEIAKCDVRCANCHAIRTATLRHYVVQRIKS